MKVVYVAGGNYKSFYINYLIKLRSCDLLIFNYGIIYDYIVKDELLGDAIVTKELMSLSHKLHCVVLAGIYTIKKEKIKSIICCDGDKIQVAPAKVGIKFHVKDKVFVVGDEQTKYYRYNKIVLAESKIFPKIENCNIHKIYFFCYKYGLSCVFYKNLHRKFNKYSQISLK